MSDAEIVRNALGVAWSMPDAVLQHTDPRFKWWDGPLREAIDAAKPALDRLQSQNQALQEALKEIRDLKPAPGETPTYEAAALWRSMAFVDMKTIARRALSPTQETDPG